MADDVARIIVRASQALDVRRFATIRAMGAGERPQHRTAFRVYGIKHGEPIGFVFIEDAINYLHSLGFVRSNEEHRWMKTMNQGDIVLPPVKENIVVGVFESVGSIHGEGLTDDNDGHALIRSVVNLSSTFFEARKRRPIIATMSSMIQGRSHRYPVKGISSDPLFFDDFEDALNELAVNGFARMPVEEEDEWFRFIRRANSCVGTAPSGTAPFDYIQGTLACVFARTVAPASIRPKYTKADSIC
jgi:hypothetical protein